MAAAVRALRLVVGELKDSGHLSEEGLDFFLHKIGFPASGGILIIPSARPHELLRPNMGDLGYRADPAIWVESIEADIRPFEFNDEIILAEVTHFELTRHRRRFTVDRLKLHDLDNSGFDSVDDALHRLPRMLDVTLPIVVGMQPSQNLVRRLIPAGILSVPAQMLVMCPLLAAELQWKQSKDNHLVYQDSAGTAVARAIWWRDGSPRDMQDEVLWGQGFLVLATHAGAAQLEAVAGPLKMMTRCWRLADMGSTDDASIIKKSIGHRM